MNYSSRTRAGSPSAKPDGIARSFALINPYLYAVDERIREQARAFDPAVEGYISYAVESRGKRIRPALALLSGGAAGSISSGHVDLAVIVELIHLATLVHDDIIDGAELRRALPSANAKWGSGLAVLLGDCLFAHALRLSTSFSNTEVSRRIADAAANVCSGEIIQSQRRFDLKLSVPDYLRIIEMKTAALFAVAAELGAFVTGAAPEIIGASKLFGTRLGTAYQIYDDILDIAGTEKGAGKTLGTDLGKGKLTLPILLLLQRASRNEQEEIKGLILRADHGAAALIASKACAHGSIGASVDTANRLISEGRAALAALPSSPYRSALEAVCSYLESLLSRYRQA